MSRFADQLIAWQHQHGRKDLPWQGAAHPYGIWVSEIMLQQTQVSAVIPYYQRFMARFASVDELAKAPLDEVLGQWSGLGYYARARNLHRAARQIMASGAPQWPSSREAWMALPGVGRSTAAAILAFSTGAREAILDGNVKRVLCRSLGVEGYPGAPTVEKTLWALAERLLPRVEIGVYTQALMDLGATLCTRRHPQCPQCPIQTDCVAFKSDRVDELPSQSPKRTRQEKTDTLWWIENEEGEVWLERRPERGVWGGLWCCPLVTPTCAYTVLEEPVRIKHVLTHFTWHLQLEKVLVETAQDLGEGRWVAKETISTMGLPQPIRALVERWGLAPARTEVVGNPELVENA